MQQKVGLARAVGNRVGLMREGRSRRMIDAADIVASDLERLHLEEMGRALVCALTDGNVAMTAHASEART